MLLTGQKSPALKPSLCAPEQVAGVSEQVAGAGRIALGRSGITDPIAGHCASVAYLGSAYLAAPSTVMKQIFHPTDLGHGSTAAFLIALRIAATAHGTLTIMHVDGSGEGEWADLPGVRKTLSRWGLLKEETDVAGFERIGMGVRKHLMKGHRPVSSCLNYLNGHPTDLIVLATHQGNTWLKRKVAEPIARGAGEPSLFVPEHAKGLVDAATGKVTLRHILVPVTVSPSPQAAIDMALRTARSLADGPVRFTLLHVGTETTRPLVDLPEHAGWTFELMLREGDTVETIVNVADATRADLVVMATKGHDGFLDMFRGSKTERVLRAVSCPLMAVPA